MQKCALCKFLHRDGQATSCRRHPPQVTALLVPVPPTPSQPNGGLGVNQVSGYPAVTPDDPGCGEYAAKLSLH